MTVPEDHRGFRGLVDLSEVSHARDAIIADHRTVGCTGRALHAESAGGLLLALTDLPDPRHRRGIRHAAVVVVAAAVCAVVAGSPSYTAIAE
ncbi:transposase family protein [Actinoplanes sp. NPDC049118]|uniref:transposase family protein n=1 Tax=Actinoplanes sp. NPDC049118 TaxID=3155769 RepID=UPI003405FCF1